MLKIYSLLADTAEPNHTGKKKEKECTRKSATGLGSGRRQGSWLPPLISAAVSDAMDGWMDGWLEMQQLDLR